MGTKIVNLMACVAQPAGKRRLQLKRGMIGSDCNAHIFACTPMEIDSNSRPLGEVPDNCH